MRTSTSLRWLVVAVSAAMLLAVVGACSSETVEVPGETVVVEKVVTETVEVPGETVVVKEEVIKTVEVPGETVTKEVVKEVMVPGETVVVEKEVVKTVEVPGQTVTVEVVKEVQVPGETVVVEKQVVKTVEVPGETVVVEKVVVQRVPDDERWTTNVRGEVVEKPRYGGTLDVAGPGWHIDTADPMEGGYGMGGDLIFEKLGIADFSIPRDQYSFHTKFVPVDKIKGNIAESWEQPDLDTLVFNIRKGVHWHDKAPMNGRELDAHDVEFTIHRYLGMGEFGESEGCSSCEIKKLPIVSTEATDKWTVEVKTSSFTFDTLRVMLRSSNYFAMNPPEVVREHGDLSDWRNHVGTGPYEMTDWVDGSVVTLEKIHDYWRNDENFPENRLPYLDKINLLIMPDVATRLATLRTGRNAILREWSVPTDVVQNLPKTHPHLVLKRTEGYTPAIGFNVTKPPFDELDPRRAMQKALDLDTINRTYYSGAADTTPWAKAGKGLDGYYIPYAEWSDDAKDAFGYNPQEAERLLDEAGFPRGSDGIRFSTDYNLSVDWGQDADLAVILKHYWAQIGVDVNILVHDSATMGAEGFSKSVYNGMTYGEFHRVSLRPLTVMMRSNFHSSDGYGADAYGIDDPMVDALLEKADAATDLDEHKRLSIETDMYHVKQNWGIMLPNLGKFVFWQPWLKGYNAEWAFPDNNLLLSRSWIDQELKAKLGH